MPSGICAPAGQRRRRLRIRRIYTPLHYYYYYYYHSTPTLLLLLNPNTTILYTYVLCRELARIETESINRKRIRKKAPTGQQSLNHRRRRRQSPCQQAQVMINVLERSSSRSLLVRILSGGCPTLSSGRNVLGILAQPSPSPRFGPASITDSKCIKVPLYLSLALLMTLSLLCPTFPFFLSIHFFLVGRGDLLLYYRRIDPIRQV